jgi:hypothetical protein
MYAAGVNTRVRLSGKNHTKKQLLFLLRSFLAIV